MKSELVIDWGWIISAGFIRFSSPSNFSWVMSAVLNSPVERSQKLIPTMLFSFVRERM